MEWEIQEVTKDYVIIDGEKIYFDEPFDHVPDEQEFAEWLKKIHQVLECLFYGNIGNDEKQTSFIG